MDLLQGNVVPAEGESTVRTYHCTYYHEKALGLKSGGFLGITNKRVIFHAEGDTPSGRSVIQSEVPIADVSGISSFKGTYFDLFAFVLVLILAVIVMIFVPAILTTLSFVLESYTFFQIIGWLLAIGAFAGSFFISVKSQYRCVVAGVSAGALLSLAGIRLNDIIGAIFGGGGGLYWILLLFLGAVVYMLTCASWFARRPTFSLEINSSGGSSTPIHISNAGGIMHVSALSIPNALPGRDAETMLQEIGALITDIQTLGDYGIDKWKQN